MPEKEYITFYPDEEIRGISGIPLTTAIHMLNACRKELLEKYPDAEEITVHLDEADDEVHCGIYLTCMATRNG